MLKKVDPTKTSAWRDLEAHFQEIKGLHMRDLFAQDPKRAEKFSVRFGDILVDYSKNRITGETLGLLFALAREVDLADAVEKMFTGDRINETERPAGSARRPEEPRQHPDLRGRRGCHAAGERGVEEDEGLFRESHLGRVEGVHGKENLRHREHRHRRIGPRASHGYRMPPALCPTRVCRSILFPTSMGPI